MQKNSILGREVYYMKFVQAQFSLKFDPYQKIRRCTNDIEDLLENFYGTPQTMPLPDEFAPEAPRIVLNSLNGHSQISFSQISVDFTANFDGEYVDDFELTKEYILKRLELIKKVLCKIERKQFYFLGITYNAHIDIKGQSPVEYMKCKMGDVVPENSNMYEASQRIALVENERFFVNTQISTFKEYQSKGNSIINLLDFKNSTVINEGVSVAVDVNDRYAYLLDGMGTDLSNFDNEIEQIFEKVSSNLQKWR